MLSGAKLDRCFWTKVVGIACYLINKYPCSALIDETPYGVWIGRKPSIAYKRLEMYLRWLW